MNKTSTQNTLTNLIMEKTGLVPNHLGGYEGIIIFLAIIIASFVISKVVYHMTERYLKKLALKTKSEVDDILIRLLQKPLTYTIMLFGFQFAVNTLDVPLSLQMLFNQVISASIIAIAAGFLANLSDSIIIEVIGKKLASKTKTTADDEALPFLSKLIRYMIYVLAFIIILGEFNIQITPLVASLGIAGFAIGFAAKDTIGNLLAGFFILIDRPFVKGDRIEIKGRVGEVVDIGLRTTRIKTPDYTYVILPNSDIISNEVVNYALPNIKLKVKIKIGVAYGTDPDKVKEILARVATEVPDVMQDPAPSAYFTGFGDSSLDFLLIAWVPDFRKKFGVTDQINTKINREFNKEGIDIPFPCRTVYLKKE